MAAAKGLSVKQNQHSVPRTYLKNFVTSETGKLCVYEKGKIRPRWLPPRKCASEVNFYAVQRPDGTWDNSVEERLQLFETRAAPGLKLLGEAQQISEEQRQHLASFMAVQLIRVGSIRDYGDDARAQISTPERTLRFIDENMHEWLRRYSKEEVEQFREQVIQTGKGIDPGEKFVFLHVMRRALRFACIIAMMSWRVELASRDRFFITSDDPAFPRRPTNILDPGVVGIGKEELGVELGFPLSTRAFLLGHWKPSDQPITFERVRATRVRHLNERTVLSATRCVFSPEDSPEIQSLVDQHAGFRVRRPPPRF